MSIDENEKIRQVIEEYKNAERREVVEDFIRYLNENSFSLRHDMETIRLYAEAFLRDKEWKND